MKPKKSSQTHDTYQLKLQDPDHVKAFYSLEKRAPKRGMGAAKLILSAGKEKRGFKGRMVSMAAAPFILKCRVPRKSIAKKQLPRMMFKHNVVTLDENAIVTFGSTAYPPSMKQRLRAEIYQSTLEMGYKGLPVDPELFDAVRAKLADTSLCGSHAVSNVAPMPENPTDVSPQENLPGERSSVAAKKVQKKAAAAAARKAKQQTFEVDCIVEEHGAWGGHTRWFIVRWMGYHPDWERARIPGRGAVGTPVETWEPLATMRRTVALKDSGWFDRSLQVQVHPTCGTTVFKVFNPPRSPKKGARWRGPPAAR